MNITLSNGEWTDGDGKVWQLVPKKATKEMKDSAPYGTGDAYEDMLNAAPLPTIKTRYDWSRIPEGFDWAVTDEDGEAWCCTVEPTISIYGWGYYRPGDERVIDQLGHCPDWRESLEKRPGT